MLPGAGLVAAQQVEYVLCVYKEAHPATLWGSALVSQMHSTPSHGHGFQLETR
jgi:hypothetical protein